MPCNISKYDDAIDLARDHTHERIEVYSRTNAVRMVPVHEDTAYLRKLADDEAVHRRGQRQQEEMHHAEVLEAMRIGGRGLQLVVEQQREQQKGNRTLLMHLIAMESKSEFRQYTISVNIACSVPVEKLTHTTPSKDEKPSRPR